MMKNSPYIVGDIGFGPAWSNGDFITMGDALKLDIKDLMAQRTQLREALQTVMDWNPKPEYWERRETVLQFEADMAKARQVLEETK
jgi:hypothetical protein